MQEERWWLAHRSTRDQWQRWLERGVQPELRRARPEVAWDQWTIRWGGAKTMGSASPKCTSFFALQSEVTPTDVWTGGNSKRHKTWVFRKGKHISGFPTLSLWWMELSRLHLTSNPDICGGPGPVKTLKVNPVPGLTIKTELMAEGFLYPLSSLLLRSHIILLPRPPPFCLLSDAECKNTHCILL